MRHLVRGQIKYISKPKDDPYNKGEKQVSVKAKLVGDHPGTDDKGEIWINVRAGHAWLDLISIRRFAFFVKEWSAKKKNKETGKDGAYVYRPVKVDQDFNVVPAPPPAEIDQSAATFLVSLLTWLSSPIEGLSPMRRLLKVLTDQLLIDSSDTETLARAFEASMHLAKMIGPETAPELIRPRVNWDSEILSIEAALQEAKENAPHKVPAIIDSVKISRFPKEVRERVRRIIDSYLDEVMA